MKKLSFTTPSPREKRALALFGLTHADARDEADRARRVALAARAARTIARRARPGSIVLITGPSGAAKSTLLNEIERAARRRGAVCSRVEPSRDARAVIDCVPGPLTGEAGALRALSAAGLADARALARRARVLSGGESTRLALARAMARGRRSRRARLMLMDEFAGVLDSRAALALAVSLRRWADSRGRAARSAVIVATARDGLLDALDPDVAVRVDERGLIEVSRRTRSVRGSVWPALVIERGTLDDYRALEPLHYRAEAPATVCAVLRARFAHDGFLAGVLVVSRPVLNARWRSAAWGARYQTGDPRADAARLNAEVRTISRVIVHPSCRGLGIGSRLVRAYLAEPLTQRTEALAAMGEMCPVFARAGMREHRLPRAKRDAALARILRLAGVRAADLGDPAVIARAAMRDERVLGALRVWADASRATRQHKLAHVHVLALLAARALGSSVIAYTHG